jgi:4-hydroxy 2-oxovalerate aldolase
MFREKIKVLDCTIRDGGLINNHQFDDRFVRAVYKALSEANVDYMEIGYKNSVKLFSPQEHGKWKFCNDEDIKRVTDGIDSQTKISVMVDVDRVDIEDIKLKKESPVDMIRVASYVKDIDKAIFLVNHFAEKGYETTINIMAISKALDSELNEALHQLDVVELALDSAACPQAASRRGIPNARKPFANGKCCASRRRLGRYGGRSTQTPRALDRLIVRR